jgi:hypothetical protein
MYEFSELLDDQEAEQYQATVSEFRERALHQVPNILSRIPNQQLQRQTYDLLFSEESPLANRQSRPRLTAAYYAERLYLELAADPSSQEALLQFAILSQECFDVMDDTIDQDLDPATAAEGIVASQTVLPIMFQLLDELHETAVSYWCERVLHLVEAPFLESQLSVSIDSYLKVLEKQSHLLGAVLGLAARVAEVEERLVSAAADLGRALYKIEAVWTDLRQYERGVDLEWNIYSMVGTDTVEELLEEWLRTAHQHFNSIAPETEPLVLAPIVVDLERWQTRHDAV